MAELRGTSDFEADLDVIIGSQREELLIGFTHLSREPYPVVVVDSCRLARDDEVTRDAFGLHWSGDLTSQMYCQARSSNRGVVLIHAHGAYGPARLSRTDKETRDEILEHFATLLPEVAHAYAVVTGDRVSGAMRIANAILPITRIRTTAMPQRTWTRARRQSPETRERDSRQVGALTEAGVGQLRRSLVGIVGLGGAGSQVAEMLAHAGVGGLVLADSDVVKDVNLSRTHGASPSDVGQDKVAVMSALVHRIAPDTPVLALAEAFPTVQLLRRLRDVSVIVSCVDNVGARDELNRFCLRYAVPLVDIGTTITPDPFRIDGHLSRILPGSHCLRCFGHVSEALLAEVREAEARGRYGTESGRPQVVSFNGLLAAAAVTEVLKIVTGFAGKEAVSREWHYDPTGGTYRSVAIAEGRCSHCGWYALRADSAP